MQVSDLQQAMTSQGIANVTAAELLADGPLWHVVIEDMVRRGNDIMRTRKCHEEIS